MSAARAAKLQSRMANVRNKRSIFINFLAQRNTKLTVLSFSLVLVLVIVLMLAPELTQKQYSLLRRAG
jgi:hypothetical protein